MLERLSPEDARILELESGAITGHTTKVVVADRAGDTVARLRQQIGERIALAPRCRQRLASTPLRLAPPVWVDDPDFDVSRHVRAVPSRGVVDQTRLRELVATLISERLPRDRPLWAIDIVEGLDGGRVAAIWRIHHAMADGQATMAIGSALLWSEPHPDEAPAPQSPAGPLPGRAALLASALADRLHGFSEGAARIWPDLASPRRWREGLDDLRTARRALGRELRPSRGRSPLDLRVGRRRRVAFLDHDFEAVHRAAHACGSGVTVNDLILGVVAGGLRGWLEERHTAAGRLRVQVPVSMHRSDEEPGAVPNRDSFINVDLPIHEEDPVRRVLRVNEQTRTRKAGQDAEELYALFADVGHISRSAYRLAYHLASNPHVFALSVSNVRGPAGSLNLVGGRIREFYSLAEIAPHHALRVSANSFGGRMAIGLCADADAVPDLEMLAAGVERSLEELAGAAPGGRARAQAS